MSSLQSIVIGILFIAVIVTITGIILDCLKNDEAVKIAGFGTYKVAKRKARIGRNPRTGEQIQIAASQKVKFLPAKGLKDMFNR